MEITRVGSVAVASAALVAGALLAAPGATADSTTLGQQGRLVVGDVIQEWTVSGLKPSTDTVPATVHGTLWEASATDTAVQGSVQPIISNLNARAADGTNYRVLFLAATPQGVNPSILQQGQSASGKVYFDVTGAAPDSVVYNDGSHDLLTWTTPPPAPAGGGGVPSTGSATRGTPTGPATAATPGDATHGAAGQTGQVPQPGAANTLPAEGGAVSAGTPLPDAAADAAPRSTGTPVTVDQDAPGGASQGTPVVAPEGTPTVSPDPADAAPQTAPSPAVGAPAGPGSSGTVLPAQTAPTGTATPTTTLTPAPAPSA